MTIQSRSDNEVQDLTSSSPNMPGISLSVHMHMLSIHSAAWQCAIHYAASLCREKVGPPKERGRLPSLLEES